MKLAKITLVVLILLSVLMPSRSVRADVAPPSQPSGSNVVPGEVTMVQMVYERVVIDLRPPWADGNDADVTARFVMRNQGTVDEQMAVGFPLNSVLDGPFQGPAPKLRELTVKINGDDVSYQTTSRNNWLINEDQEAFGIDWAVFNVTFPVGNDVIIELNYKQPPTYDAPTTQYDYVLFTGAGWYGPIKAGDIILRLPYTISYWENYWTYEDNLWGGVNSETIVENEARWHFENFEPQDYSKDNWSVGVIRPKDWERVLVARESVMGNQYDAELWMELGDAYRNAAMKLGGKTYDASYPAITAYEQSVALKPDWADAHARLAFEYYKAYHDQGFCATEENPPDENLWQGALSELSIALALDPMNKTALNLQETLNGLDPQWELPPPTPYATPFSRAISTPTLIATPVIVTVVHTQIANHPTSPLTATGVSTQAAIQNEKQNGTGTPLLVFGALFLFLVGIGAGRFWSKRAGK